VAVKTDMFSLLFIVLKVRDINIFRFISLMSVIFTEILVRSSGLYGIAASGIVLIVCRRNDVLQALNSVYEL
jgi:hypothetical protein